MGGRERSWMSWVYLSTSLMLIHTYLNGWMGYGALTQRLYSLIKKVCQARTQELWAPVKPGLPLPIWWLMSRPPSALWGNPGPGGYSPVPLPPPVCEPEVCLVRSVPSGTTNNEVAGLIPIDVGSSVSDQLNSRCLLLNASVGSPMVLLNYGVSILRTDTGSCTKNSPCEVAPETFSRTDFVVHETLWCVKLVTNNKNKWVKN